MVAREELIQELQSAADGSQHRIIDDIIVTEIEFGENVDIGLIVGALRELHLEEHLHTAINTFVSEKLLGDEDRFLTLEMKKLQLEQEEAIRRARMALNELVTVGIEQEVVVPIITSLLSDTNLFDTPNTNLDPWTSEEIEMVLDIENITLLTLDQALQRVVMNEPWEHSPAWQQAENQWHGLPTEVRQALLFKLRPEILTVGVPNFAKIIDGFLHDTLGDEYDLFMADKEKEYELASSADPA